MGQTAPLPTRPDDEPSADTTRTRLSNVLRLPATLRRRLWLVAAAAVVVAVVGGTLAFQAGSPTGGSAVVESSPIPSSPTSAASDRPSAPPSPDPGQSPDTGWHAVADLTADTGSRGVVDVGTSFRLASLANTPVTELVQRLTVDPPLAISSTVEPDGRVRITPSEPLIPGVVYRFALSGADGEAVDSWAFQARQALGVVSTLPADTETGVPTNTGIEVTFDQDGVVDVARHMTISPKVEGRFEQHGRVLVFVPKRLAAATIYTVTVRKGVTVESTGEALEQDVRFRFETGPTTTSKPGPTTYRFTSDLIESATAARPVIGLRAYIDWTGRSDAPKPPKSLRLDVYRLADRAAAIDAFRKLRGSPRWSQWNGGVPVPTKGLTRLARVDARMTETNGVIWTQLPDPLAAGWYLVMHPSSTNPAQAILQVSDLAGYLAVSETRTLLWMNDLASKRAIDGADVSADGMRLGRTSSDGTLTIDTPDILVPDLTRPCVTGCEPVVTVSSGGRSIFLPARGTVDAYGGYDGVGRWGAGSELGLARFWRILHTDRTLYRRSDTINVWGVVRDRASGAIPPSATVRLRVSDGASSDATPPIARIDLAPRPTGAFSGSIDVRDLSDAEYRLELVVDGDVISTQGITVGRILKPSYRLEVTTGRRIYMVGDRIKVTTKATFYDGTPVPGVRVQLDSYLEKNAMTDAEGTAVVRGVARPHEGQSDGPSHHVIWAQPGRAEEGEIEAASREFIVFPSALTVAADSQIRNGRLRLTGTVHAVDVDRLESEVAGGASIWELDPRGAAARGQTVRMEIAEIVTRRTRTGTTYDFIEKRTYPTYEYTSREVTLAVVRTKTDQNGNFAHTFRAPSTKNAYIVRLGVTDRDGNWATAVNWASADQALGQETRSTSSVLDFTGEPPVDQSFRVSDRIDLTVQEPGRAGTNRDRHLFTIAQNGIRDVSVRSSSRFTTTFPTWGAPNLVIRGIRFTGAGYVISQAFHASFRSADRAIAIELRTDKTRYAPRDEVTISVTTRNASGAAVPATVVLNAVDEKLYTIGAAGSIDPLSALYAGLGEGIQSTYVSHQPPDVACIDGCGDTTGGGGDDRTDFRDFVLFRAVDTGADGRGSVRFRLSDDLTSWRVTAAAIGDGLRAGGESLQVPVGLPFFADASIAPEYLRPDRPIIQVRAFGSALAADTPVTFAVDSDSLGLHVSGLRGTAFRAVDVPLPTLKLGTHAITITARTGSGASASIDRLTRTFMVVESRLTRIRTAYLEGTGRLRLQGGAGLTRVAIADAGSGRMLPLLLDLASAQSARLERSLAADVASSILISRFADQDRDPNATTFDGSRYQRPDGGLGIVPYGGSDLEASALAAIVAPDRFAAAALRTYLSAVRSDPAATRERRNFALAGLAGLGAPVLPEIRTAAIEPGLTVRERLVIGLGAAAIGDGATARSVAASLVAQFGEGVDDQARLRVGDQGIDISVATALMAMLTAATGDPMASRYWAYVEANPSDEATHALHAVGYARSVLDHAGVHPARFAYEIDGARTVVDLEPGGTFHLTVTKAQLAGMSVEPIEGTVGVSTSWDDGLKVASLEQDPDVKITRTVRPNGTIRAGDLVVVDLTVTFGRKAPDGCHRVIDLAPSGLVPVGTLRGWVDPRTGNERRDYVYPDDRSGQRVVFCAAPSSTSRTAHLRYYARVITVGRYAWEPAVLESRTGPDRAAVTPRRTVAIR